MIEEEEFFSPNHKRLLSIAVWAKYLAWVVLVVNILWAIGTYTEKQTVFLYYGEASMYGAHSFIRFLKQVPSYALSVFIEILGIALRGVVYFLILKGVSLGLNMIVETDINYREQKGGTE
ncbi:MAG: hypothetical protein WCC12_18840 [Anaerolineales bacterium]